MMHDLADVAVLPAGRDLDALVAEKVIGWERRDYWAGSEKLSGLFHPSRGFADCVMYGPPECSTDDGIAITEVALPMSADGRHWWAFEQYPEGWMAHLREHPEGRGGWLDVATEFGETLALAICRTALAAKVAA